MLIFRSYSKTLPIRKKKDVEHMNYADFSKYADLRQLLIWTHIGLEIQTVQ